MRNTVLFVAIIAILSTSCRATAISLEAERGTYTGYTVQRGRASEQRTVRLRQGQYVENSFTTRCRCSVRVTDVIYTNDGGADTITVSLDGRTVDTFRTLSQSNYGHLWNVPRSSGRVGNSVVLGRGEHAVRIEATRTDRYLVEIDKVVLALDCGSFSSCHNSSTTPPPVTAAPTTITTAPTTTTTAPTTTTSAPTTATPPTTISLEAERGTYTGHTVQRSHASGLRTVRLRRGQYVENSFTTRCNCSVTVTDVIYTNDGGSDTITLRLDGRVVGTFRTRSQSNYGNLWNVPRSSGRVGSSVVLGHGEHTVRIEATRTDRYLVEIDKVVLALDCGGFSSCHNSSTTPLPVTTTTTAAPTTNTISLEAEHGTYTGHTVQRGNASGQRTVRLKQGQYIVNTFSTKCSCSTVTVTNTVYTNDGNSDTITVSLDDRVVGAFHTISESEGGNLWNNPRRSGRIGRSVVLGRGVHTVRIEATRTDHYLVEIDRVILTVDCSANLLCRSTFREAPNTSATFKLSLEWLIILAVLSVGTIFIC